MMHRATQDRAEWAIAQIVAEIIALENGKPAPVIVAPSSRRCPDGLKRRLFAAFAGCEYCGQRGPVTADRIVPRIRGGSYNPDNVTAACMACNVSKGTGDFIGPVRSLAVKEAMGG